MQFRFCPQLEQSCPHVGHCPHLGGAALGTLVTWANTSGDTIDHLHKALDAERERNAKLVEENLRLERAWEQAKLELKLERQNKFATRQQKQIESCCIVTPLPFVTTVASGCSSRVRARFWAVVSGHTCVAKPSTYAM
jgi:hypothetical protein